MYNICISEQILPFCIEHDTNIAGVYLSFIIPLDIVNNVTVLPNLEKAEQNGLVVDAELTHHYRRVMSKLQRFFNLRYWSTGGET
jgi:hypothetical protein